MEIKDRYYESKFDPPPTTSDPKILLRRIIKKEQDRLISARIGINQDELFRIFKEKTMSH